MKFTVAVFPEKTIRGYKFSAYTRTYSPAWDGCNEIEVEADTGKQAKETAIRIIRTRLVFGSDDEKKSVKVCRKSYS